MTSNVQLRDHLETLSISALIKIQPECSIYEIEPFPHGGGIIRSKIDQPPSCFVITKGALKIFEILEEANFIAGVKDGALFFWPQTEENGNGDY